MRRPIEVRVFGGVGVAEETIQRLLIHKFRAGWRHQTYGFQPIERPTSLTFTAPEGRYARRAEVSVVLDPARGELKLIVVVDDQSEPDEDASWIDARDEVAVGFVTDVLGPAAEAAGAALCMTPRHVGLHDLVPRCAAAVLQAFARAVVREGRLHPNDEARIADVAAAVHATRSELSGELFAQWLYEDVGWPASVTARLARELDRALAVLTAYDKLRRRRH